MLKHVNLFAALLVWSALSCSSDTSSGGGSGSGGAAAKGGGAGGHVAAGNGGGGSGGSSSGATLAKVQQTLFTPSCAVAMCHDSTTHQSALDLSSASVSCAQLVDVAATESGTTGPECRQGGARKASFKRVVANDSAMSFLYLKLSASSECVTISGTQAGERMPKDRGSANATAVAAVKQWIDDGASCD